jgi:hypothetical protein
MVLTRSLRVADMIKLWALERLAAVIAIAAIVRDGLFFSTHFRVLLRSYPHQVLTSVTPRVLLLQIVAFSRCEDASFASRSSVTIVIDDRQDS